MQITKKDGTIEEFNFSKIDNNLKYLCKDYMFLYPILKDEIEGNFYKSTKDVVDDLVEKTKNLISPMYPEFSFVAGKALLQKYYKEYYNIKKSFEYPKFSDIIKIGIEIDLFIDIEDDILNYLDEHINYEYDNRLTYVGVVNMFEKYLVREIKELPQLGYMRVALSAFIGEIQNMKYKPYKLPKEEYKKQLLEKVVKHYHNLAKGIYSEATPKWLSALSKKQQVASCVKIAMGDDSNSILKSIRDIGIYSKYGGGIGVYGGYLRGRNSVVGISGKSDGVLNFAKLFEATINSFNQQGKRKGSGILWYDWWGYDIEEVVMLNDKGGVTEQRARNLKIGVVINKLLLDRVIKDEEVCLFSADVVDLQKYKTEEEFNKAYLEYERNPNIRKKVVKARGLVTKIVEQRKKTGNIYIMFKEIVNGVTSPFYEPIVQSNLCVAPETKILTKEDYKPIVELVGRKVDIWNGEEWSKVGVVKTGTNQKLLKIKTTVGEIECTPYHKFYLEDGTEVRANELKAGNILISFKEPNGKEVSDIKVLSIIDNGRYDDTYCFTEPKRHMGMFNGMLTGQCNEITLPTEPMYVKQNKINTDYQEEQVTYSLGKTALCNLASINLVEFFKLETEEQKEVIKVLLETQDNLIEYSFYPSKSGEYTNKNWRPIGLGMTNLAQWFALNRINPNQEEALKEMDNVMYTLQSIIIDMSSDLSKERGYFNRFKTTKWADDNWVDSFVKDKYVADKVKKYGVRFVTNFAIAPTSTSALTLNATEGADFPKKLFYIKETDKGNIPQVVPNLRELRPYYVEADKIDPEQYIRLASVRQKYMEQGQSLSLYETDDKEKSYSVLEEFKLWLLCYELNVKGLYYFNGKKGEELEEQEECLSCSS